MTSRVSFGGGDELNYCEDKLEISSQPNNNDNDMVPGQSNSRAEENSLDFIEL